MAVALAEDTELLPNLPVAATADFTSRELPQAPFFPFKSCPSTLPGVSSPETPPRGRVGGRPGCWGPAPPAPAVWRRAHRGAAGVAVGTCGGPGWRGATLPDVHPSRRPGRALTPDHLARRVRAAGVRDVDVLAAIREVPRAAFVPAEHVEDAYRDAPIPIRHDQVTTQPSLSAQMIAALELTGAERVLEIGTGLGFQTALLAQLAAEVVTIER